jgi:hypothetical protein
MSENNEGAIIIFRPCPCDECPVAMGISLQLLGQRIASGEVKLTGGELIITIDADGVEMLSSAVFSAAK